MRVLIVEDEPYLAEAIRDGLRLEAIAADIAGDGDIALERLSVNAYDIAVLDRDVPGPSGDEIAKRIVASGSGMPILMLTAADRLDDKATGFELSISSPAAAELAEQFPGGSPAAAVAGRRRRRSGRPVATGQLRLQNVDRRADRRARRAVSGGADCHLLERWPSGRRTSAAAAPGAARRLS
jgi:CheY-like chemotaxis protein